MKKSVNRGYAYICAVIFALSIIYSGFFIILIIELSKTLFNNFILLSNQPLAIMVWIDIGFCLVFIILSILLIKLTDSHLKRRAIEFLILSSLLFIGIGFICLIYGIIIFRYVFVKTNYSKNNISYYEFIGVSFDKKTSKKD